MPHRGSRVTDASPAGGRVLFYSHDGTGLGHLRITLGVATAYAQLRQQDSLLLVTGSLQTGAFALPDNLDYVKLPAMPKRDLYASLPPTEGYTGSHNSTIRFRTAVALATIQAFDPHLVVIDHAPAGLFRELAPSIDWLRRRDPPPSLALLMRDVTFGPEQTRSIWTNEGVYPLLDQAYDRILVYGDRRVFDPIVAYGMSELAATRTRFCGYLAPLSHRRRSAPKSVPVPCRLSPSQSAEEATAVRSCIPIWRGYAMARAGPCSPMWLPDRCFRNGIELRSWT
jgi:predicted glycosyltransferase